ncbi:MAG: hypothetical protein HWN66_09285 [Candidatus Helarchaeota archaeon]|nr:hypothetical protein [Candidatus Helarchaeota archaeon]
MYEESNIDLKPEPQHLLQHEFSVIVFIDYLSERPFDLIYQEKTIHQYQNKIMGELVSVRNEIRESWIDNRIDDGVTQVISKTEEVAKEHGFSQSIRRQSMKWLLPMMVGFFALAFATIFFIPPDMTWVSYVIFPVMLLVVCILPRLINQRLLNRWMVLSEEQGPVVKKYISGIIERFHKFIQFLINDIREILADNDMDFTNYRLMLFNPEYENVKVLSEEQRKGVKFYIMELLPFDTESKSAESQEESYYDEFESPES